MILGLDSMTMDARNQVPAVTGFDNSNYTVRTS
jgi:hypothetical protein